MVDIHVADALSATERSEIRALHEAARAADGYASLGDTAWRALEPGGVVAGRHFVARTSDGRLVGYGSLTPADNAEPPHLVAAAAQSTGQPMDRPPEERELGHGLGRTVHIRGRDTTCGHP